MIVFRALFFGFAVFLMAQGLFDLLGISRSIPSIGAIVAGLLAAANYPIYDRYLFR